MEVQNHGVLFEDNIIKSITGLSKDEYQQQLPGAYVAVMDIAKGVCSDTNYSIKVSKDGKSIGCGDILRFLKHTRDEAFTIILGEWSQKNATTKTFSSVYEFYITPADYASMFGNLTESDVKPFVDYVKSIEPGKSAQLANQKLWKERRADLYNIMGQGLVKIDAKIDSKNQRRVQCSFTVSDLINAGISHSKYEDNYKGISLPYDSNSSPRSFKKS